jgi:hypothetical protein
MTSAILEGFVVMMSVFRVISEKKRLESSSGGQGIKIRDIETEELLEDQHQKIRWPNN